MTELQGAAPSNGGALAFQEELAKAGWQSGKNVEILWRSAESDFTRFPSLIEEMLRHEVAVIVVGHNELAAEVRKKSRIIPIVMSAGFDVVKTGLVRELAKPGGNVTGVELIPGIELFMKRLEVLRELVPGLRRVAYLCCIGAKRDLPWGAVMNPAGSRGPAWETSPHRDVVVHRYHIEHPEEIDAAIAHAAATPVRAIMVVGCAACYLPAVQAQIHAAARKHSLPTMHESLSGVETGGLVGYGTEPDANLRRAAHYVARILAGAKPGELPVERMDNFKLYLNIRAAASIGMKLPESLVIRADKVFD